MPVQIATVIEFLDAVADTKFVDGPFHERGGVILVGPPGIFKTTMIETALESHTDALTLSDLNVHQWLKLKDSFVARRYTCLGFGEFEKIYQRHPATAQNLEGILKALVSEGFGTGPNGDPRMPAIKARCCVVGGITTDCFERHYDAWQKNGFLRRFIWLVLSVRNPEAIVAAIRNWQKINFGRISYRPANKNIPMDISPDDSRILEKLLQSQPGLYGTGYVLMKKVAAVLKWKYQNSNGNGNGIKREPLELLMQIAGALSDDGDEIVLPYDDSMENKILTAQTPEPPLLRLEREQQPKKRYSPRGTRGKDKRYGQRKPPTPRTGISGRLISAD